jgi:ribulose-5-phosphate 4-epimerase/fuculose-1-phosphate aldolase
MQDNDKTIADKLAKAWRFLYDRGFIEGFGHISARSNDKNRILISPHSLGPRVTPEDFVLVDLDGRQYGTVAPLPGETPIHLEIYKARPDVASVAHFHCLYSTSFGMSDQQLRPTYFLASIFRDGVPIHQDSRLVSTSERGSALAKTLGAHRAAIIKAHGVVVVGQDVEEMLAVTYILEDNAHRTWIGATMGEVQYLDDETMTEIESELLKTRGPFRRIWAMCECHSQNIQHCEVVASEQDVDAQGANKAAHDQT